MSITLSMGEAIQPKSRAGGVDITPLVIQDLQGRIRLNSVKYPYPLQADNGRNCLADAYHEALDLAQYLRQALEEQLMSLLRAPVYVTVTDEFFEEVDDTVRLFPPQIGAVRAIVFPHNGQNGYITFSAWDSNGCSFLVRKDFSELGVSNE